MMDIQSAERAEGNDGHDVRGRIVSAAAELIASGGRDAVTTRAVAATAGVQAPTIYRLFGDKGGLLDAVAEQGFADYLREKKVRKPDSDPIGNLRTGWDLHVGFGLANPAIFSIMFGDPRPGVGPPAAEAGYDLLRQHVRRVAAAGRLRVNEERAVNLMRAAGTGTVLALLTMPEGRRDMGLSEAAREAVIAAITSDVSAVDNPGPAGAAIALRAVLPEATGLTDGERRLMAEWLDRLAGGSS
ncbi:TetR/AcrR family transcriptional regulator [Oricola nitratireducens]|uniref:TetR/AcrR family transcriptional regulator n=1 Tax=Oricola nitratireducens TaxID=2775868 RepID=UPI001AEDA8FC|nr:TetR/AcrR family transcriptional regulator [Oricola nitratireducens]